MAVSERQEHEGCGMTLQDIEQMYAAYKAATDPVEKERLRQDWQAALDSLGVPDADPTRVPIPEIMTQPVEPTKEEIAAQEKKAALRKKVLDNQDMESFTDEELDTLVTSAEPSDYTERVREERSYRRNSPIASNIGRGANQVVSGAIEAVTTDPVALGGLALSAGEHVTGYDLGSEKLLKWANDTSDEIRGDIGAYQPQSYVDSALGFAGGTALGLGFGVKTAKGFFPNVAELALPYTPVGASASRVVANFGVGFAAEQGVRELADNAKSDYETVTDAVGITGGIDDKGWEDVVSNIMLTQGALVVGAVFAGAPIVKTWKSVRNGYWGTYLKADKTPKLLDQPDAPAGLHTIERTEDLWKARLVDTKQALVDMIERGEAPNLSDISDRIESDTGMDATIRINTATQHGQLRTKNGDWNVKVAPDALHNAYKILPKQQQLSIDAYMKWKDIEDKTTFLIKEQKDVPLNMQRLQNAQTEIARLEQAEPLVKQFHADYSAVMQETVAFLSRGQSSMVSGKSLGEFQRNRPNYVPIERTDIDPEASLGKR